MKEKLHSGWICTAYVSIKLNLHIKNHQGAEQH